VDVDWDEKVNVYARCVTRVELFVCRCGCDHVRVRGLNLACRSERAVVLCVCACACPMEVAGARAHM